MADDVIEGFAFDNNLDIKRNVFHGAVSVELRKCTNHDILCIGYIAGNVEIEIYTRRLRTFQVLINDKLWPLKNILRYLGYDRTTNYQCITKLKAFDFNVSQFIAIAQRELKQSEKVTH